MAEESQYPSSRPDNKRKFDDPSPAPQSYNSVPPPLDGIQLAKLKAQEIAAKLFSDAEAKRPKVDNGPSAADDYTLKPMGQQVTSLGSMSQPTSFTPYGYVTSKKIDIPNGRVGVIIGRSGETIKNLQLQSGAKIQVTRDADSDPYSLTRPAELTGTPEQISRAEELIKDVLAEADSGGSGAIAARKVGGAQPGAEQFVMKIPNNKVGLIIGKGGETIKNMQANSGARIQVIPLHLPPGDTSTERTLQIDGTKEQIEAAKKLVNEIVSGENRARNLQMGGGYPQQSYRPPLPPSWGPPGGPPPAMQQQQGYGYAQPGAYPGAPPQYAMPQPPYGGSYPPQPAASAAYPTGWDQSSTQGTQQTTSQATTGYDYYTQQQPTATPVDNTGYVYGQGSYGDALSYSQQQTYGYSQPSSGYEQSQPNGSSAPPTYGSTMANPSQDGFASGPTYAAQGATAPAPPVQPSPTQQGYVSQPGYGVPPTYGQSAQSQKPPAAATPSVYGQPPSSQAGSALPPVQPVYGQVPPPPPAQQGYAQPYQQVPPSYGGGPPPSQVGYNQQQSYGDSYASVGGYSQPPPAYGAEGGAAPAVTGGVTKASPQS